MASQESDTLQQHLPEWLTLDKDSDTKTPVPTEITGKIPKWLSGNLYRNGSGIFQMGDQKLEHLFDGFAIIHRYVIRDGEVQYQTRILDTDTWVRSCKANRLAVTQFGTFAYPDPCKSIFDKMMSYMTSITNMEVTDNTSVNIVETGDKLYATTETTIMNEVDPETLLRRGKVDLADTVSVHLATAHPHLGADGTMYNLGTSFNPRSAYNIVAVPPLPDGEESEDRFKKATLLATLPSSFNMHVGYNHSFGMSDNYFVILEQPLAFSLLRVLSVTVRQRGIGSCLVSFPQEKMKFHVIRRSDNQLLPVSLETDPTVCFHFVNCFEVEDQLVVDLCGTDDLDAFDSLYLDSMANNGYKLRFPITTFRRYVLPISVTDADADVNLVSLPGTQATAHMVSKGVIYCRPDYITDEKIAMELPRINYKLYNGRKYRFAYGMCDSNPQLVKVDLEKRTVLHWKETGFVPSEPVFVPRPGATDEDDGVVLSSVLSELPHTPSFLLLLDAKTFKEVARATAPFGVKVALTYHGSFVADSK